MPNIKAWIEAARLRTLPLALSVILMGAFLAASEGKFDTTIFVFCILTTLFLQVLSNFANDFGDTQNGADNELRRGPQRAVQSGALTKQKMLGGIVAMTVLSFASGLTLLKLVFGELNANFIFFLMLGIVAIAAAIKYTAGKNPYGYQGLGDVSVFIFFGLVGVMGSYFLFTKNFNFLILLPAATVGFYSTGVLNLNNLRDIMPDTLAGKKTLPTRFGFYWGVKYQIVICMLGWSCSFIFLFLSQKYWQMALLVLPLSILFLSVLKPLAKMKNGDDVDGFLKKMALNTLFIVLVLGISIQY